MKFYEMYQELFLEQGKKRKKPEHNPDLEKSWDVAGRHPADEPGHNPDLEKSWDVAGRHPADEESDLSKKLARQDALDQYDDDEIRKIIDRHKKMKRK